MNWNKRSLPTADKLCVLFRPFWVNNPGFSLNDPSYLTIQIVPSRDINHYVLAQPSLHGWMYLDEFVTKLLSSSVPPPSPDIRDFLTKLRDSINEKLSSLS